MLTQLIGAMLNVKTLIFAIIAFLVCRNAYLYFYNERQAEELQQLRQETQLAINRLDHFVEQQQQLNKAIEQLEQYKHEQQQQTEHTLNDEKNKNWSDQPVPSGVVELLTK
ncbi:hypothetical protein ACFQ02_03885 [Seminibacterium arietis]|uniref:Uncharacterized protein n=1 Tax=Seminibacterium arietis TaxID=1173502 RepID=A0ABW3I836_9PAST